MRFFATLLFLFAFGSAQAITYTWTNGAGTARWDNPLNWSGGPVNTIPDWNDDVVIQNLNYLPFGTSDGNGNAYCVGANAGGAGFCKTLQLSGCNATTSLHVFAYGNLASIQNCTLQYLNVSGAATAATNAATVNVVAVTAGFNYDAVNQTTGGSTTLNITGSNLSGSISNTNYAGVINRPSTVTISGNTIFKGSITTGGLNTVTNLQNMTLSNNYSGSRTYAMVQNVAANNSGGVTDIQNCVLKNVMFSCQKANNGGLTVSNCTTSYDSTYAVGAYMLNFDDYSNISWNGTDINVAANYFSGYTIPAEGGIFYLGQIGRGHTVNANINLAYTQKNGFVLFTEPVDGTGLGGGNLIDPPTLNGNLNIAAGGWGFRYSYGGAVIKINGNINHTGTDLNGNPSFRNLNVDAPNNLQYGGYFYLQDEQGGSGAPQGRNTLILGGNTNTHVKWPTNFFADQLVIDKQGCTSVTIDSSVVVGTHLKLLSGTLKLPGNINYYKLVVNDSLKINSGAALLTTDFGSNHPNILMNRTLGSRYGAIAGSGNLALIDKNTTAGSCNGLSLPEGTKIVFSRGADVDLGLTNVTYDIDFLNTSAILSFNVQNHLRIKSLNNYNTKPRVFLTNYNLIVQTPVTGYSNTQFITTNGIGQLLMPVGSTPVVFPVGLNQQDNNGVNYNPVTLTNTGIPDTFGVSVSNGVLSAGTIGVAKTRDWVNKTWNLTEKTMGGSNLTASFQWFSGLQLTGFFSGANYVSQYQNNSWDIRMATAPNNAAGYLVQTRSNITSLTPFGVSSATTANICPGNNFVLPAGSTGNTYQWQADAGNGFTNISDGANYSGTTTPSLSLLAPPTSFADYKYRCLVNSVATTSYTVRFATTWYGTADTNWANPANWACGTLPDGFTDVVVPVSRPNYPALSANSTVRTLYVQPGTTVRVASGTNLIIKQ